MKHAGGADLTIRETALSSVVARSIVRGDVFAAANRPKESEILLAIRHPDSNPPHPSVVSVPTGRIPPVLMQSLIESLVPTEIWLSR